jgi:hypothetical protein
MKIVDQGMSNQGRMREPRRRIGLCYEKELEPRLPFLSSRVILGHMTRFAGYKYQRPDSCKKINNSIKNLFRLPPPTLGAGVRVDLDKTFDKSSCIG